MTRRGGWRTRVRVQWVRLIAATLQSWLSPSTFQSCLEAEWEYQQRRDHQRVCPHEDRFEAAPGYTDCRQCGACLATPWGVR